MSHPSFRAGRISQHGQIEDLTEGFSLPNGKPFSLFFVPLETVDASVALVDVTLQADSSPSPYPFRVGEWDPAMVKAIEANETLLDDYQLYWGA